MKTGVIIGAAMIGAAYLYMRRKPALAGNVPITSPGQFAANLFKPDHGYGYDPVNPGDLLLSKDLINGTIADYSARQIAGYLQPSVDDLITGVVRDWYGSPGVKVESVVKNPGALW